MTYLDRLLSDYARLRNGEADQNTAERDKLVEDVRRERDELVAALRESYHEIGGGNAARYGHKGLGEYLHALLSRYPDTAVDGAPRTP